MTDYSWQNCRRTLDKKSSGSRASDMNPLLVNFSDISTLDSTACNFFVDVPLKKKNGIPLLSAAVSLITVILLLQKYCLGTETAKPFIFDYL